MHLLPPNSDNIVVGAYREVNVCSEGGSHNGVWVELIIKELAGQIVDPQGQRELVPSGMPFLYFEQVGWDVEPSAEATMVLLRKDMGGLVGSQVRDVTCILMVKGVERGKVDECGGVRLVGI